MLYQTALDICRNFISSSHEEFGRKLFPAFEYEDMLLTLRVLFFCWKQNGSDNLKWWIDSAGIKTGVFRVKVINVIEFSNTTNTKFYSYSLLNGYICGYIRNWESVEWWNITTVCTYVLYYSQTYVWFLKTNKWFPKILKLSM